MGCVQCPRWGACKAGWPGGKCGSSRLAQYVAAAAVAAMCILQTVVKLMHSVGPMKAGQGTAHGCDILPAAAKPIGWYIGADCWVPACAGEPGIHGTDRAAAPDVAQQLGCAQERVLPQGSTREGPWLRGRFAAGIEGDQPSLGAVSGCSAQGCSREAV